MHTTPHTRYGTMDIVHITRAEARYILYFNTTTANLDQRANGILEGIRAGLLTYSIFTLVGCCSIAYVDGDFALVGSMPFAARAILEVICPRRDPSAIPFDTIPTEMLPHFSYGEYDVMQLVRLQARIAKELYGNNYIGNPQRWDIFADLEGYIDARGSGLLQDERYWTQLVKQYIARYN